MRKIEIENELDKITYFIKEYMNKSSKHKAVVGISGGLDSAVTACLATEALGTSNVFGVLMPYKQSSPKSLEDAQTLVTKINLKHEIIDTTPIVDSWFDNNEPEVSHLRKGNFIARIRMAILYDFSAKYNALVLGTGNLSELMLGYVTHYGDNACAFEPIGHLYKTEVKLLANILDVPHSIINKAPSADLWKGQTDEGELGLSYEVIDNILYYYFEKQNSKEMLIRSGFSEDDINKVINLYQSSKYKRHIPPTINDFE